MISAIIDLKLNPIVDYSDASADNVNVAAGLAFKELKENGEFEKRRGKTI